MKKANGNFNFTFCLAAVGILLAAFSLPVFGAIPSQERAALIALFNSTNGDNWTNKSGWKTPPLAGDGFALPGTENTWQGIGCDRSNTTVQSIYLSYNNLRGTLPPELGNLANLQTLYLASNRLSGSLPPELGNPANLQKLSLDQNQLSGTIPPELGNLANLCFLRLDSNKLSGPIPPELGNLANLQCLLISSNQLSGSIPPELGNLADLQQLYLNSNQLSGTIPPELGNLTNLRYLYLCNNKLSGSIPPELGNMDNLTYLLLLGNQLSGTIPPELANLANLFYLALNGNQLSGSIPPELASLANLNFILLGNNQLSGTIPPELGNLVNLKYLWLNSNRLSGTIPPELGNLANLWSLDLSSNILGGSIPPDLGNLANLELLWLSSNKLSGSIPSNLTNLTNLLYSELRWNALYTNDDTLRAFLNSKQSGGNWESTQTIAPSDMTAVSASTSSIDINWTPISYTADTGGYRVFYSTTTGGPYTYFGITADKTASSFTETGLNPGTTYYFAVQTRTNPHHCNKNTVDSEYSAEVSAATTPLVISGIVTSGNIGLPGVNLTLDNGGGTAATDANGYYSVAVPYGWSGTAIPFKYGYDFTPVNRSYTNVTVNQTNQDFLGALTNQAPVADAGDPQSCIQGDIVSLNGSASYDPDGDPLTYYWLIVSKPAGSNAYLTDANSMTASLQTDAAGEYVVSLTVNDGLLDSTPGTLTVTAISFMEATTQKITELKDTINTIPATSFDNKNDQENMIKKINQILDLITINNDYCGARAQLQNSILNKIDGCAIDGNPHPHDSITTCPDQAAVYPLVQEALSLLDKIISNLGIIC
jgi:Leucine-rich repeat (LRR) protein